MSKEHLPTQVDPIRFAEAKMELRGVYPLKEMPRLCSTLENTAGDVAVDLQFGIDRQGIRFVKGHIQAVVSVTCQRCMEPFLYEITTDVAYAIVSSDEEAKQLPSRYEPVFMVDGNLQIEEMVEDELLVDLPIVSMHEPEQCAVKLPILVSGDSKALAEAEKENPFKVIELLKPKPKQE